MQITPEAKLVIDSVLETRECDCISLEIVNDNGKDAISLQVGFSSEVDASLIHVVDGVNVIATEETMSALNDIIFVLDEDGRLSLMQPSCGCGGGCCGGDGHDDGGCCCGEGHDHEGGCCGGGEGHHHDHEGGCCGGGEGHHHDHEGHGNNGGGCCCGH